MKITTWNVNGIRAVMKKGAFDWVRAYAPDVLCMQEVKARYEQLDALERELQGYACHWNPAVRPGYSGVATYTRCQPLEVTPGLGDELFDVEGRVIRMRFPGFLLYNVYFPSGQRGYERVVYKLAFYARLLEECDALHRQGERLVICGDFNTAHSEIDLANPKSNHKTSGYLPEERAWVDRYLEHGLVDAYRRLYPERVQYTWWTYVTNARSRNVGWRLDYFLVSEALVDRVAEVIVHDEVPGSDHCPVTLVLREED
jgi:exodeoxyribonuclease-3